MSTSSKRRPRRTIEARKEAHLAICTDPSRYTVEGGGAGFEGVRFVHVALPELSASEVDTSTEFLGARLTAPFLISCMTGGSPGGKRANRMLASAAQELRIPVGLGSVRAALRNPDLLDQFYIKPFAPDVPVLANLGAVQARDYPARQILELCSRLEAQALVLHLNPGQELFQPDGDRDFRGLKDAIQRLCEVSTVPVIVKETGFGITPALSRELLSLGAAFVDLAGAGGTNWISVESYRVDEEQAEVAREFSDWGVPTSILLAAFRGNQEHLIASGGVRSGVEAAKAVAMGAELVGFALPVIRAVASGGAEAVVRLFRSLEAGLRAVMVLTASHRLQDLRRGILWQEPSFAARVHAFLEAAEKA